MAASNSHPLDLNEAIAKDAAAQSAFEKFALEVWVLLAISIAITLLRMFARAKLVGLKGLQWDDFLACVATVLNGVQAGLAYSVGKVAHGMANNSLTNDERAALSANNPEHQLRVIGSKIQLAGWSTTSTLLWCLKAALLVLYYRLTARLGRRYKIQIRIGFALLAASYIAVLANLFLGCFPLQKYWQIYPDPGDACYPAVSRRIIWVYLAMNVITDIYLISIPIPMLWGSTLNRMSKIWLMALFSGGFFVISCATVRCVFIISDPVNGPQLAGSWAVRETFVAIVITNLPTTFPLLKQCYLPIRKSISSRYSKDRSAGAAIDLESMGNGGKYNQIQANPVLPSTYQSSAHKSSEASLFERDTKHSDVCTVFRSRDDEESERSCRK
ncbi:hypothetical protein QQS21_000653 [Conoideocrella luteorostrata]|uniref:Rhodopsin domain-containing protein n=1 Tax=Conoideocrella luteorostrata TaxID=1105319 RepID=A0AAJ0CYH2_9HYPO|nr:hypothetical protein QQS21_000653 [Conoideocrella luteorostrata]